MMNQISFIFLVTFGVSTSAIWNCSNYYANRTVTTVRESACFTLFGIGGTVSLEGQDPLLMNSSSSRSDFQKVLFCAKAALGRGFRYFGLKNDQCTVKGIFTSSSCTYNSSGCTHSSYPCITNLTSSSCQCGTTSGAGGPTYYNLYYVSNSHTSSLGLWFEVEDIFNNTVEMFDVWSPKYIELLQTYKSLIEANLTESKICGVKEVISVSIGRRKGPGSIMIDFKLTATFFNLTIVREMLQNISWNAKDFGVRQLSGDCSEDFRALHLDISGGTSFTSPTLEKRSGFSITYSVTSSCYTPLITEVTLKVASISKDGYISNFTTFFSTMKEKQATFSESYPVPPVSWNEGLNYVIGEAWTPEDPSMRGFDYTFRNVTRGDLVAHLFETSDCVHVLGIPSYVNASGSYDSNAYTVLQGVEHPHDLRYTWICSISGESLPDVSTPTKARQNLPFVQNGVSISGKSGGCFGSGPGLLKTTKVRAFYFESSSLSADQTVNFKVFVEKGDRFVHASKSCLVAAAPVAKYNVRCTFNCGPLMKSTARLGLKPICENPAGCSNLLNHTWKFFIDTGREIDNGDGTFERVWRPYYGTKNLTDINNIYMVLNESSFEQNRTYRAQHIVKEPEKRGFRVANYIFTTNTFPHSGTCKADNTTIRAALDTVNITCTGWIDEQPVLTYEAWVLPHNTKPRLMYYGNSTSFLLRLPVGDSANNFELRMEIKIFDIYESTSFHMNLTVIEPTVGEPFDTMFNLINEEDYDGDDGDDAENEVQQQAQKSIATLSLLGSTNFSSRISVDNKTIIRKVIISKMVNISANDTQSINQVAGVLIDSTSNTDELSTKGQMQSIEKAFVMSESLKDFNATDDPAVFEQVGTTLLHLTGNVIDGAATNPNISGSSGAKALGETALKTSNTISSMLIDKMMGGEQTKSFLTPSLGLEISKTKSEQIPEEYSMSGGGVSVPPVMKSLTEKATLCPNGSCAAAKTFISTKMLFSKSNPYTWGNNSIVVKSPVVSLDYLLSTGDTIPVGSLDSEFKLTIPTKPPSKQNKTSRFPFFVTPNSDCAMHRFIVPNNDTAFETIIELEEETFVTVFIRHEIRPSEENYDYVFHHPNLSSCVEPPERDNCTGVFDFSECMGFNITEGNQTSETSNDGRCESVTIPDVSFLSNTSLPRDLETCRNYHDLLTCPVPQCALGNASGGNISQNPGIHNNQTSRCGNLTNSKLTAANSTPEVCQKVKDFLNCKNASLEKYEECKGLLTTKKLIYEKYDYCSENINRTFFGLDIFRKAGWYYVAICYPLRQKHVPTTPEPTTTPFPTTEANNGSGNGTGNGVESPQRNNRRKTRSYDTYETEWMNDDIMNSYESDEEGKDEEEWPTSNGEEDYDYDAFLDREEEPRVLIRSRREMNQRKCVVDEKPAPTTPPLPTLFPPVKPQVFNVSSSLNYSFDINLFTCLFWNTTTETWSTNGCKPHKNSTPTSVVCMCNHLTSFGADMLVAPNEIDFDKVFASFANPETDNFSVTFTILGLFLLYALVVVWARKADKRDLLLVSKTRVGYVDPSCGGHNYEIAVSTGTFRGSGTTANVALTMVGEKGMSPIIPLVDEAGSSEELLARGNVVYFIVNIPEDIGEITYIRIWHNNQGTDPSWFMRQITIRELVSDKKWLFLHNDWFAVDRADGKIDRRIYTASESEKSQFKTLFYSHTAKSFSDKHLWISVVLRSPSSSFTRVQRLTCCLSLLLCAMLANAMFYQHEDGSGDSIQVGPIKLSLKQIIIGIQSGLIVAPVNLLIITLFRKARPKTIKAKYAVTKKKPDSSGKYQSSNRNKKTNKSSKTSDQKKNKPKKKKEKKKGLPHWWVYVAYSLCMATVLASATFVIFYSMMWGPDKSNEWIISVILSLIQDILFIQPSKVVVLAMILSFIFKRPPEEDPVDDSTPKEQKQDLGTSKENVTGSNIISLHDINPDVYEPLDSEKVGDARDYQKKKNAFRATIKEIVWHVTFVLLVSGSVFGTQSSHRFQLHDHLVKLFPKSELVKTPVNFWWWCETYLIPGLYNSDWYNGQNFTDEKEGFISNKRGLLISMPRLRQVRVKPEECSAAKDYPKLKEMFPTCYSEVTLSNVEESFPTTALNPKVSPVNDSVLSGEIGFERICLQPFMAQSAEKLGTLPVVTNDATYPGSGLVADLGYDNSTASEVVFNLEADKWITRQTRVVFVEFVVFEPTSQLYAIARFVFEQKSIGRFFPSKSIMPYALYGTGNSSLDSLILVVQFLLVIFVLICLVKEIVKMVRLKVSYFMDLWNIHQLVMLGFTVALVILTLVRDAYIARLIKTIQDNPYARMSFDYVKYGTDVWNAMASMVVFLQTLKLLQLLVFTKTILTFFQTIRLSGPFLVTYGFFFMIVFLAFAQCGNLIFGQQLVAYSSVIRSFVNVFQMALGNGLFYHELKDIAANLGQLFILCYFLVTTLLLVNFFVSILNDSYADGSKKIEDETNEEALMAAFMSAYLKSSLKDISSDLKMLRSKPYRVSEQEIEETSSIKLERETSYFLY